MISMCICVNMCIYVHMCAYTYYAQWTLSKALETLQLGQAGSGGEHRFVPGPNLLCSLSAGQGIDTSCLGLCTVLVIPVHFILNISL